MRRIAFALVAAGLLAGCGSSRPTVRVRAWTVVAPHLSPIPPAPVARPVADFVKQATGQSTISTTPTTPLSPPSGGGNGAASDTPGIAPGAPSDAEVERELAATYGETVHTASALVNRAGLSGGLATTPPTAPPQVDAVIAAANQVARYPYVYGGGHATFEDTAYDCSGSVSFALAAAGLLHETLTSTGFESYGAPGPGKWITIYANAGHAWMTVAGLRYDTGGLLTSTHSRWQTAMRPTAGFVVRHPIGL